MHILSMWSKKCGIQIKLKRIFSPLLQLLSTLAMMSRTLADTTYTKAMSFAEDLKIYFNIKFFWEKAEFLKKLKG